MTDRADRPARLDKPTGEIDGLSDNPQVLGRAAARNDQQVELFGANFGKRGVHVENGAFLAGHLFPGHANRDDLGSALLFLFLPLYLLWTQKRVYAQGWFITLAKYAMLGTVYTVLLSLVLVYAVLAGMTS